uniref:Uncharacterized protein n=1 Tax=viral metagenome TaxID=1070528 RepID=A0A6C0D0L3_9ZZZZ
MFSVIQNNFQNHRVLQLFMIWIGFVFGHFLASHLYIHYCVPWTWTGLLASPFITMTPHCTALRWCIWHGASHLQKLWISLGTWCFLHIFEKITIFSSSKEG